MLVDSNILIYAGKLGAESLQRWVAEQVTSVSAITLVEILGYPRLDEEDRKLLRQLLAPLLVCYPTPAIALRQQRKMTLGDVLIAATCLERALNLATHNTADFAWITGLNLIDPLGT